MRYWLLIPSLCSLLFAGEPQRISLESLIAQMLENNSDIASSLESLTYQKAGIMVAQAQFDTGVELYTGTLHDTTLHSHYMMQAYPGLKEAYATQGYSYGATASKLLEYGATMELGLSSTYTKAQSRSYLVDTSEPASVNNTLSFSVNIPLLKNAGSEIVTTGVESAKINLLKSKYTLAHVVSTVSNEVISGYWNYLGAHEKYKITLESEALAQTLLNNAQKLILNDVHPKSEMKYSLANLHAKKLQTIVSKDALNRQWSHLITLAGLSNVYKTPQEPQTSFPKHFVLPDGLEQRFIQEASTQRYDLKTHFEELKYLEILRRYYHNQLKPDLALHVGVDYKFHTQEDGVVQMLDYGHDTSQGNKIYANLVYKFTADNNKAQGEYVQALSKYTSAQLSKNDLIRSIEINIASLLQTLKMMVEQIDLSTQTIQLYEETVENEQKKYSLGISTINDVITIQNNLMSAKMTHVDLQNAYAIALSNLLFQSGKLVQEQGDNRFIITHPHHIKGF